MKFFVVSFFIWTTLSGLATNASAAGGEDFPFFCSISNTNKREAFKVVSDNTSSSGYMMYYYQKGHFVARMPVRIDNTVDNKHLRLWAKFQKGLFDRHLIAFVGKTSEDYSSADSTVVLHGVTPSKFEFKPLRCQ